MTSMRLIPALLVTSFIALSLPNIAAAKVFRNSYISFELPNNWRCNIEGTEWSCFSQFAKKGKEAVIIITAKEAGPADTLPLYTNLLKKTRTIPGANKKPVKSKVQYVKQYPLGGKNWVDSLHLSSEVEAYYTRYVATVHSGLAILVTFSAHRAYYSAYSEAFRKAINSLKVVAGKNLLNRTAGLPKSTGLIPGQFGQGGIGGIVDMGEDNEFATESGKKISTKKKFAYLLILFSIIGVIYYFIKTKK